jgi:hypothetical protein
MLGINLNERIILSVIKCEKIGAKLMLGLSQDLSCGVIAET